MVCLCSVIVSHEVLFNTVLDACIYRRQKSRLAEAIEAYVAKWCPRGWQAIAMEAKYCRIRKCFSKESQRLEINLSLGSDAEELFFKFKMLQDLTSNFKGVELPC